MATKTIGITDDVYERLAARKRGDESFTDLIDRLLEEASPDWREGFGTLSAEDAEALRTATAESRASLSQGLADRQTRALDAMTADEEPDETP